MPAFSTAGNSKAGLALAMNTFRLRDPDSIAHRRAMRGSQQCYCDAGACSGARALRHGAHCFGLVTMQVPVACAHSLSALSKSLASPATTVRPLWITDASALTGPESSVSGRK